MASKKPIGQLVRVTAPAPAVVSPQIQTEEIPAPPRPPVMISAGNVYQRQPETNLYAATPTPLPEGVYGPIERTKQLQVILPTEGLDSVGEAIKHAYYGGAIGPAQGLGNLLELSANVADMIPGGNTLKPGLKVPAAIMRSTAEENQKIVADPESQTSGLLPTLVEQGVSLPMTLAPYLLPGGATPLGMAAIAAAENLHRGPKKAIEAAVTNAIIGTLLPGIERTGERLLETTAIPKMAAGPIASGTTMGTLGAGGAFVAGATPQEALQQGISQGLIFGGISAARPKGKTTELPPDLMDDLSAMGRTDRYSFPPTEAEMKEAASAFVKTPVAKPMGNEAGVLSLPTVQDRMNFITDWVDQFAPSWYLSRMGDLSFEKNPYYGLRTAKPDISGKQQVFQEDMRNDVFLPAMKDGTYKYLQPYMLAERHIASVAENPEGYTIANKKLPDGTIVPQTLESLMADMAAIRNQLGPEGMEKLEAHARTYRERMFREAQEYEASGNRPAGWAEGLLDKESNQYFVPFLREELLHPENKSVNLGSRPGIPDSKGKAVKGRSEKGSELPIADLSEATMAEGMAMIRESGLNRARGLVANLADDPDFPEGFVRELKPERGPLAAEQPGEGEAVFTYRKNGVDTRYAAPEPVARMLNGLSEDGLNKIGIWGRKLNKGLILGSATYYMPFITKNVSRDMQTAYWRSPVGFSLYDWARAFASVIKQDKAFLNMVSNRGGMAGFFEHPTDIKKAGKRALETRGKRAARELLGEHYINPLRSMEYLANAFEMTPRRMVDLRAKKQGWSPGESGWAARNITVDFNRIGRRMRNYNAINWPFNAKVQGLANTLQTMRDTAVSLKPGQPAEPFMGSMEVPSREFAKRSFVTLATTVGLPVVAAWGWNTARFPDVWDKLSQFDKDNYLNWILGRGKNEKGEFAQVFQLPKPDMTRLFGNVLEAFLERGRAVSPKTYKRIGLEAASELSPVDFMDQGNVSGSKAIGGLLPWWIRVPVEWWSNKELRTGQEIEKRDVQGKGHSYNRWMPRDVSTPAGKALVGLSYLTPGIGPEKLAHGVKSAFGSVGRALLTPVAEQSLQNFAIEGAGLGALARTYTGAKEVGPEAKELAEMDPLRVQEGDRDIREQRALAYAQGELKNIPQEQQGAKVMDLLGQKKITIAQASEILDDLDSQTRNLTYEERQIKNSDVRVKALLLLNKEDRLPPEQYMEVLNRWIDKGLVGDTTWEAMDEIRTERALASMEQGAGSTSPGKAVALLIPKAKPPAQNTVDRNNNPGALKDNQGNFIRFAKPEDGLVAQYDYLDRAISGRHDRYKPTYDLRQFFGTYAPKGDGDNDPGAYAQFVADRLQVPTQTKIKDLSGRLIDVMNAIQDMEGWHGPRLAAPPNVIPKSETKPTFNWKFVRAN